MSSMAAVSCTAYGREASTRCCAFTMREDAISSMARVIFFVDWTERIRRRTTRSWAPMRYADAGGSGSGASSSSSPTTSGPSRRRA